MIYTTYLSNIKNIPNEENTTCILVTRWKPRNTINTEKYKFAINWLPILSPSETLLTRWKSNENMKWSIFKGLYLQEAKSNKEFTKTMDQVIKLSDSGKNVFLVCYEKDDSTCHRSILRELFHYNDKQCIEY